VVVVVLVVGGGGGADIDVGNGILMELLAFLFDFWFTGKFKIVGSLNEFPF
jgi:hypothetical protein